MGIIKVICILLWYSLIVYFFDILLIIHLAFRRLMWKFTTEKDKAKIRQRIINLENQQDEHNELALKVLRDYYHFIKEN